MALKQLLNGSQPYKFALIEDTVDEFSFVLLRAFINESLCNGKEVHVFCFDQLPADFERNLVVQKSVRLYIHDFFTDSAEWLRNTGSQKVVNNKNIFSLIHKSSADSSGQLVIIDSLSSFISSYGLEEVYRQIHQSIYFDSFHKSNFVRQLVSVIYKETILHYDTTITLLKHLASVWIAVLPYRRNSTGKVIVKILHKKANGKLLKQVEECYIDSAGLFQSKKVEITKEPSSKFDDNELPSQLTTFNLGLKEEEKLARSKLVLPYLKTENSGGSIYYEPDENDDWDEEDPDDDLDV
ncbi:elongator complex protein 5 [Lycorma delicatula]|uniref:elongator complex protein 5 n=1 Tax=Lycorma delicatula TaxID=130591 RepID=UPI003F5111C2